MKPSVVIDDNGTFRRFPLNTAPNTGSRAAGTLRCAQAECFIGQWRLQKKKKKKM